MANIFMKIALSLTLIVILAVLAGCVERELTINTTPEGGLVYLNDEEVGIAPVTVSFLWYGDYKVRVVKDGYQTLNTHKKLERPTHDKFPFDLFAELWPKRIVDSYEWTFQLEEYQAPNKEELIKDAQALRNEAMFELGNQ